MDLWRRYLLEDGGKALQRKGAYWYMPSIGGGGGAEGVMVLPSEAPQV